MSCAAFSGWAGYGLGNAVFRTAKRARQESEIQRETDKLLQMFGLAERAQVTARNLPYGDQRRLEIVRALATKPKLLLLDEPTSGMNPSETDDVTALISRVRSEFDLSVLLIEHHMSLVMGICERVIVLDGGVKIADDAPRAVQNNPHVIAAYLGEADPELDEAIAAGHEILPG
jgi:branched-chain amino acid transport system ATP-binding protein